MVSSSSSGVAVGGDKDEYTERVLRRRCVEFKEEWRARVDVESWWR